MPVTITNNGIGSLARTWLSNVVTFCRDLLIDRSPQGASGAQLGVNLVRLGTASDGVAAAALAVMDQLDLTEQDNAGGQSWVTFPFESSYELPWASDTHQCLDWYPEVDPTLHEADLYNSFCGGWEALVVSSLTRLRDALNAAGMTGEAAVALSLSNAASAAGNQSSALSPQKSANVLLDMAKLAFGTWVAFEVLKMLLDSQKGGN